MSDRSNDRTVESSESSSFLAFKEAANESLGLPGDDDIELVPLNLVLSRIEALYARELSHFDTIIATIRQDELYFRELGLALDSFQRRLVEAWRDPSRPSKAGHVSFILYTRFPGSKAPTRRALGRYGKLTGIPKQPAAR